MTEHEKVFMTRYDGNVKFILMMTSFIILAVLLQGQQSRQNVVYERQRVVQADLAKNQGEIRVAENAICLYRNKLSDAHNLLVSELMTGVDQLRLTPVERALRMTRYKSSVVKTQPCPPLPEITAK